MGGPVLLAVGASSLTQTALPGDSGAWHALLRAPRLDAVVRRGDADGVRLEHYRRDQGRPDRGWQRGLTLTTHSVAPGALVQRCDHLVDRTPWRAGTLEVLSPEPDALVHRRLVEAPRGEVDAWAEVGPVAPAADAVALVARPGVLDALVRHGARVDHHRHTPQTGWFQVGCLEAAATGAPALAVRRDCLLAVVPTRDGIAGFRTADADWEPLGILAPASGDPGLAFSPDGPVLAVPDAVGVRLLRGTGAFAGPWLPAGSFAAVPVAGIALVATALGGGVDLSRVGIGMANLGGARLGAGRPGTGLQALVGEGAAVFSWRHDRHRDRWSRADCLRWAESVPDAADPLPSRKVAQVSGETDSQPWADGPHPTLSRSASVSGVRGTDLGVRVEHRGRSYLLCGDTHWDRPWWATRDSLAAIAPYEPGGLPRVTFHGGPLRFSGRTTMTEYDVPLDAFSLGEDWFCFATSHHFSGHRTMGRSVLARALDDPAAIDGGSRRPFRFRTLATVSDWRFINLACARVPGADLPGLAPDRDLVALWGSGAYRADDLRLAVLDPEPLRERLHGDRGVPTATLGLRYFAGTDAAGAPRWSWHESDAATVVAGAFGELSVRWVAELGRWVLLAMSGPEDPAGFVVTLRTAPHPWGPWSPRRVLFDWIRDGKSGDDPARRFIRAHAHDDPVGDAIFSAQAESLGGAYAPYLFDARTDGEDVVVRYTLSTWNPYQIVLMEHRLAGAARR